MKKDTPGLPAGVDRLSTRYLLTTCGDVCGLELRDFIPSRGGRPNRAVSRMLYGLASAGLTVRVRARRECTAMYR